MNKTKTVFITYKGQIMHKATVLASCSLDQEWIAAIRPDLAGLNCRIEVIAR